MTTVDDHKILRDAGFAPPEVALFHERAPLREAVEAASAPPEKEALMRQLSELEQKIAPRLESLRANARL